MARTLLNQVLAIRDDHSMDPDIRPWVAIELLAQRLDALSDAPAEEPIAGLSADAPRPKKVEVWYGGPARVTTN